MPTKTKAIIAKKVRSDVGHLTADALAASYASIMEREKSLAADKAALKEEVLSRIGKGDSLSTAHGTFRVEERRSYSWSVDAIKQFFGKGYVAYIKADDRLIRVKMESEPELADLADVTVTEALTLKVA